VPAPWWFYAFIAIGLTVCLVLLYRRGRSGRAQATAGGRRYPRCVTKTLRLLQEIEAGALDNRTPIGDLLRKVLTLGGEARSAEMRDWALRELRGYVPQDELPPYRRIVAPLQMDGVPYGGGLSKNQMLSPMQLPDFARDEITNDVILYHPITEIERLARDCPPNEVVKLGPPGSQELVLIMNSSQQWSGHIERIYWAVVPVALEGVVDQVRTTLTTLVAEINASMPDGAGTPTPEVATNAINFAVTGKRNRVSFAASQDGGSTVATTAPPEDATRPWARIAWAVIAGLLLIAGSLFALMQVQGWTFG
jgi:hypothetical protein